jgi:DNA-binding transcriptional LysR family regulator
LIAFEAMTSGRQWSFRGVTGEPITVNVDPRFLTNSGDAAINHALADGGITAAFCYQVNAAIRAGSLVMVLDTFSPSPVPIQALFPTSRLLSSKVRAFLELAERAAPNWKFLGVGEPWRATKSL